MMIKQRLQDHVFPPWVLPRYLIPPPTPGLRPEFVQLFMEHLFLLLKAVMNGHFPPLELAVILVVNDSLFINYFGNLRSNPEMKNMLTA